MKLISLPIMSLAVIIVGKFDKKNFLKKLNRTLICVAYKFGPDIMVLEKREHACFVKLAYYGLVTNKISKSLFRRFSFFPNIRKHFTSKKSSVEDFEFFSENFVVG